MLPIRILHSQGCQYLVRHAIHFTHKVAHERQATAFNEENAPTLNRWAGMWLIADWGRWSEIGYVTLVAITEIPSWCPIFLSSHCNLFEDRAPIDDIYGNIACYAVMVSW